MVNSVGLYIGEKVVSAAVVGNKGKGEVRVSRVNVSSLEGKEKEVLNKNLILETMINKCLREVEPEDKEIFISLADKEFIFRCIDLPLMGKQEIESSIMFEIEKYVPFKIRDLIWDYSFIKFPQEKKIKVSFLGIRKKIYQEYMGIFQELDISVKNIEPSSVSLVRIMKSMRATRKVDSFILLDFSEDGSYITFFYKELPIFNRYLDTGVGGDINIEKLSEEVRISIQYFRREFRAYELTRMFVICREKDKSHFTTLDKYVEGDVGVITSEEIMGRGDVSVEHVKSYAVASTPFVYYRYRPLLKEEEEGRRVKEEIFSSVPLNVPLLVTVGVMGMLVCMFLYMFFSNSLSIKRYELKKIEEKVFIPPEIKKMSIPKIKKYFSNKEQELADLQGKLVRAGRIYPLLKELPEILGKGVWLDAFSLARDSKGGILLSMSGYVFRDSLEAERSALDDFIVQLRQSPSFKKIFSTVDLVSSEKGTFEGIEVLRFSLKLR